MARTAALLVIGNEILSGKVEDQNIATIAKEMFALGVRLARVVVCADDMATIIRDVNELRSSHDVVFTTGGIGPTHDDLTYAAIAAAFGRPLERSADLEGMIRARFQDRTGPGHLRLADIPQGAELVRTDDSPWPIIAVENVYVFPGVPDIVRAKLPLLRDRLRNTVPLHTRSVFTTCDEFAMSEALADVALAHPAVQIGSYPRWDDPSHKVKLTFDGTDPTAIDAAVEALLRALPAHFIAKTE